MDVSKFVEFCYLNKLYNDNFSEINKIFFYYLINLADIANKRYYPYFNEKFLLYYFSNPNYEYSFKREVVARLIKNIYLFSYKSFIFFIQETSLLIHKEKTFDLFFPFNPYKLDRKFISGLYFKGENKYKIKDVTNTLNLSHHIPISEKIFLLENLLNYLEIENVAKFDLLHTYDLLAFIKCYKLFHIDMKEQGKVYKGQNLFNDFYIKIENKLKFRIKKYPPEKLTNNLNNLFQLFKDFSEFGKFIDNSEIFQDFFHLLIKVAEIHPKVRKEINKTLTLFVDLHPKSVLPIIVNNIFRGIEINYKKINIDDVLVLIKALIYSKITNENIFSSDEEINFVEKIVFTILNSEGGKFEYFGNVSVEQFLEFNFYLVYFYMFDVLKKEKIISSLNHNFEIILDNLYLDSVSIGNNTLLQNYLNQNKNENRFSLGQKLNDDSKFYLKLIIEFKIFKKMNLSEKEQNLLAELNEISLDNPKIKIVKKLIKQNLIQIDNQNKMNIYYLRECDTNYFTEIYNEETESNMFIQFKRNNFNIRVDLKQQIQNKILLQIKKELKFTIKEIEMN